MRIVTSLLVVLLLAGPCLGQDPGYAGIWQDVDNSANYFAISENGDALVLISLASIELSRNTLKSSYIGNKSDLLLTRVEPDVPPFDVLNRVKLEFQSSSEGTVYPVCEVCTVRVFRIRKIF
jgi:hypothetical protein